MLHQMKLQHAPFMAMHEGCKTIEMRLFDEKRQGIRVGDEILFTDMEDGRTLRVRVMALHRYPDFAALYAAHNKVTLGYRADEAADPQDMTHFYPACEIAQWGVVGIEIQIIT